MIDPWPANSPRQETKALTGAAQGNPGKPAEHAACRYVLRQCRMQISYSVLQAADE
jgi:hypothetical protein